MKRIRTMLQKRLLRLAWKDGGLPPSDMLRFFAEEWEALPHPDARDGGQVKQEEALSVLPVDEQTVIRRFLTDDAFAGDIFPDLSRLHCEAWEILCAPDKEAAAQLIADETRAEAAGILMERSFPEDFPDTSGICTLLSMWAVFHGVSPWGRDLPQTMIRAELQDFEEYPCCLYGLLTPEKARNMADALIAHACACPEDRPGAQLQLYALLRSRCPLDGETVERICRELFEHDGVGVDCREIGQILREANAEVFESCVEAAFRGGNSAYAPCQAAIRLSRLGEDPRAAVRAAQNLILGQDPGEALIGAWLLLMRLEQDSYWVSYSQAPLVLERETDVTAKLIRWLCEPEGVCYPVACDLSRKLYLRGGISGEAFLREDVLRAACIAWKKNKKYVTRLLSVLPLLSTIPHIPGFYKVRRGLEWEFETLLVRDCPQNIIEVFCCCGALGVWDRTGLFRAFGRLLTYLDGNNGGEHPDEREYVEKRKGEILKLLLESSPNAETRRSALQVLFSPAANVPQTGTSESVTTQEEAMELLRAFRDSWQPGGEGTTVFADRFAGVSFEVSDPGSCLVADWFYALCALGLTTEAVHFYRRFAVILDRPWRYYPDTPLKNRMRPYHAPGRFWTERSRLAQGAIIAVSMGHRETFFALLTWVKARAEQSDELTVWLWDYNTRPPSTRTLRSTLLSLRKPVNGRQLLEYWCIHYDDPGLTAMLLEGYPHTREAILGFGYDRIDPVTGETGKEVNENG